MVEHYVDIVGVTSSNLVPPTILRMRFPSFDVSPSGALHGARHGESRRNLSSGVRLLPVPGLAAGAGQRQFVDTMLMYDPGP